MGSFQTAEEIRIQRGKKQESIDDTSPIRKEKYMKKTKVKGETQSECKSNQWANSKCNKYHSSHRHVPVDHGAPRFNDYA
jgi:hypothetical protein